ncbi:MAG TPA: SDR family oxidoreductase [Bryobacteraceae bacterium]|nr:SDR family oxidoreductase [Bryobacteraceae bacterium]
MNKSFVNRPVALITGASSGIGATFARKLAGRGFNLILVARRADKLAELARDLPVECEIVTADLSTDAGVSAVTSAIRGCAELELLVNNAGFGTLGRFWSADLAGQDSMHRVHVLAVMQLTRAALEGMTARNKGGVINVSSVAAFSINEGNVSYCSTKAWMNSFTEGLALELNGVNSAVKVQALCPGFTITEFHDTLGVDRKGIPGFLWMQAHEIVDASLRGLDRGKVIVVPGWIYRTIVSLLRPLPFAIRRHIRRPFRDRRV